MRFFFRAFFPILRSFSLKLLARNNSYISWFTTFFEYECGDHNATWHFYYENASNDCQYYTADKLTGTFNYKTGFSIVHFICRSLPQNFERIKESVIETNNNFDIVALTETWLNENNQDDYVLDGYEVCHIIRKK